MLRLLLAILLFLSYIPAFAYENERTIEAVATTDSTKALFTTISTGTTVDTVSESLVNLSVAGGVGVMWRVSGSGAVNVSLQGLRSFQRPTSETLSDSSYVVWNSVNTTTDTNWHMATLDTVVEPYLRFRVSPLNNNSSTNTIQIKVQKV